MYNYLDQWVWAMNDDNDISAFYILDESTLYTFWKYDPTKELIKIAYVSCIWPFIVCSLYIHVYMLDS